jgi:cytochrome d ubiquinol oxidase subunit II
MNYIQTKTIIDRCKKQLLINAVPFVLFFLIFVIWLLLRDGFASDPLTGKISIESNKYWHNLIDMPLVLILFLAGVVLVLSGITISFLKTSTKGIWYSGTGTILVVFSLFLIAGFNNTAFYPSTFDLQSSLTIKNSSSSHYTLTAMSYVSLFIPFVLVYIVYAWRAINKNQISLEELKNESHIY